MANYSLSISPEQLNILIQAYKSFERDHSNQYVAFSAVKNGLTIHAYKTGKVVLQGDFEQELSHIKSILGIETYAAIGSDEVGTGDLFGPIVVCSAYVSKTDIAFLESLGVKDSKAMTDTMISKIGPILANRLIHSILILNPEKYNEMVRKGYNMNKIKAYLHNHAIIKTSEKLTEKVPVILDQFCEPPIYFNYLKTEKLIYRDINFYTKAESVHISVAAASIIARYAFLAKMQQFSKFIGLNLLKGAGSEVDKQLVEIYKSRGYQALPPITKLNFKNLTKNHIEGPIKIN
ncbi:ribonuclease HIII [Paracholeplasma manati]|jgi:ribonuclease HIII|uniref:Ribonuclease HIII n=1 Tax=Paracholeplasma manati TaxID=591373 RepID=A0ABT2Y868_9MOLU|nr:ribonuclease HIII [Paracholeplasma manati]MCV2232200.1 ribonuclease HIII [Paracholeplasma manati]MDG0888157.1 ribonuclease HIII [Paracholeplasma manati]MDX9807085.1 ribonuclease HIII [Acholeplasma sp.]